MSTMTPGWEDDLTTPACDWLASNVAGWDNLTDTQATAWMVALLDTVEQDFTTTSGDASFEVGASQSVTGNPVTFDVLRGDYVWAIVEGGE